MRNTPLKAFTSPLKGKRKKKTTKKFGTGKEERSKQIQETLKKNINNHDKLDKRF